MNEAAKSVFHLDPHGFLCGLLVVAVVVAIILFAQARANASRDLD